MTNEFKNRVRASQFSVRPENFFLLRTPTLTINELREWGSELHSSALIRLGAAPEAIREAWKSDVRTLRSRLTAIVERPEILQALFLASPSLTEGIRYWKQEPTSKRGIQAERSLVRYFQRMCSRPTPFGSFSGVTIGQVLRSSPIDDLRLASREAYRCIHRVAFPVLSAIVDSLCLDQEIVRGLRFCTNPSLIKVDGAEWQYINSSAREDGEFHKEVVRLEADEPLETCIQLACDHATGFDELITELCAVCGVEKAEAEEYVFELVRHHVLIPELYPSVSGPEPFEVLIEKLKSIPAADSLRDKLDSINSLLKSSDRAPLGIRAEDYMQISMALADFHRRPRQNSFRVDLVKPPEHVLIGREVTEAVAQGISVLACMFPSDVKPALRQFKDRFVQRYDLAWVPLGEALETESGIGFEANSPRSDDPLLEEISFPSQDTSDSALGVTHRVLMKKVVAAARAGLKEVEVTSEDLATLMNESRHPLRSGSLAAFATHARKPGGRLEVFLSGAFGPTSASMLGRFCSFLPELTDLVKASIAVEEPASPDTVIAEVVHLPDEALANLTCRPSLREYEILLSGGSTVPRERQILLNELLVTVRNGVIVLYSPRLKRRIVPSVSNAHNYALSTTSSAYRFLCSLQQESGLEYVGFSWGPLEHLDTLPRVVTGNTILSLATWKLSESEIESLSGSDPFQTFVRLQEIRHLRSLPQIVNLQLADMRLRVDLDNPLSVDAFTHLVRRNKAAVLVEQFPLDQDLSVTGPEGVFEHEVCIPLSLELEEGAVKPRYVVGDVALDLKRIDRKFPPGSEWDYLKIYGNYAVLDELVTKVIPECIPAGLRWFFIRYADPDAHLRLRLSGASRETIETILRSVQSNVGEGRIWKVQADTYEREIERYGGLEATRIAEDVFCADSCAVVSILQLLGDGMKSDMRLHAAALGIDSLLDAAGLALIEKTQFAKRRRAELEILLGFSQNAHFRLPERIRARGEQLGFILDGQEADQSFNSIRRALGVRSEVIKPKLENLRALGEKGILLSSVDGVLASYAHMHVNRMLSRPDPGHDLVLNELLLRCYLRQENQMHCGARPSGPESPLLAEQ